MAQQSNTRMVQVWWSYCPLGSDCTKGHGTLGRSYSEARGRQRIYDHLVGSPHHKMEHDEAQAIADGANDIEHTLITETVEEEPWDGASQPANKRQRKSYRDGDQIQQLQPGSSSNDASRSSTVAVPIDLASQIKMQTRNAFVFCKDLVLSSMMSSWCFCVCKCVYKGYPFLSEAMSKAQAAIDTAAKFSRQAARVFEDLLFVQSYDVH